MDRIDPETEIGGFRVKSFLGEGAMAQVYLAHDLTLGRRVALKLFKRVASEPLAELVLREAQATAALEHPNIVQIYQTGSHGERPFLALEFIDGETLRARLQGGPLAPVEALRVALAIADALVAAHDGGYVHGDLKPENVLISSSGRVRLVDFGLARIAGGDARGGGTAEYMAPECWLDGPQAASVDVWALGVVLHEMLTGTAPFTVSALVQAAYQKAPLSPPAGADATATLVAGCLTWDPMARLAARAVAESLRRALAGAATSTQPPFRGLIAFSEADAIDFCGRDDETDAALERLRRATLLAIVGPSGVGKSSLVRARIAPRLRAAGGGAAVYLRPGSRPLTSLVQALAPRLDGGAVAAEVDAIRHAPDRLRLLLAERTRAEPGGRVVLVVDQLEEALTLGDSAEAQPFFAALSAVAREPAAPWRLIALCRDDFLGRLYQTALADGLDAVLPLRPMSSAELEAAIRGPVRRCGYTFDPAHLPTQIALEVAAQPAPLPLLQFACHAIWERRDREGARLLGSAYQQIGGAAGALAREGEQLVATLSPSELGVARALLLSLVAPDGTRVPGDVAQLGARLGPELEPLVERFVAHRLLSIRSDGEHAVVELAHESLALMWPELRRWLDESSEARRLSRDLEEAAELWHRRGRSRAETWRGEALRGALGRLRGGPGPSLRAEEFLAASRGEDRRAGRLRRGVWSVFLLLLGGFATTAAIFALRFREDERRAQAQKEELRVAAENMGQVALTLAPYDWDEARLVPRPLPAASLPQLGWRLWRASATAPDQPLADTPLSVRALQTRDDADGARVQTFEAPGGVAFLEIFGRGQAESCASSWVRLRAVPGYHERRRGQLLRVRVDVPTCRASRAGEVVVTAGPFRRPRAAGGNDERIVLPAFTMDRTEVTNAAFAPFGALLGVMGYEHAWPPEADFAGTAAPAYPVTGVDAATARAYCRYVGKELPTREQWMKAYRGPADGKDDPLSAAGLRAAAAAAQLGAGVLRPAAKVLDRSPFGTIGMAGNVREWSLSEDRSDPRQVLRYVMGGDVYLPRDQLAQTLFDNLNHPRSLDFALGFRCVAATSAAETAPASLPTAHR